MPELYSQPITVALNLKEGYDVNPISGDSMPHRL